MTQLQTPVFISVDAEFTGQSTYNGDLCSIGAVAVYDDGLIDTDNKFYVNLEWRGGGSDLVMLRRQEQSTMEWWQQWPFQWKMHRTNTVPPQQAMEAFNSWLLAITVKPIFVAWPAAADWQFINHYFWEYINGNPFGYSQVCLKNFALGKLNRPKALLGHREETEMPDDWLVTPEDLGMMSHIALDDAIAQAHMLKNILNAPQTPAS